MPIACATVCALPMSNTSACMQWPTAGGASPRLATSRARAPAGAADATWHALATLPGRWAAPAFPLRAADFIKRGLPKGPRLGAALAAAEEAWTAAGFPLEPDALAAI